MGSIPSLEGTWSDVEPEDLALFYWEGRFHAWARVIGLMRNRALARRIWGEDADGNAWEFIYALGPTHPMDVPFEALTTAAGYDMDFPRGTMIVRRGNPSENLRALFPTQQPSWLLRNGGEYWLTNQEPSIADTRGLLADLIGREIRTAEGATSEILRLWEDSVLVATTRSPEGNEVPVSQVHDGHVQLVRDGEIRITPEVLGYWSSFVGAVLGQLPGAQFEFDPVRVFRPTPRLNERRQNRTPKTS